MMRKVALQREVLKLLHTAESSGSRSYIEHIDGVLRGLIWAQTGTDPGTYLTMDTLHVCQLLKIPAAKDPATGRIIYMVKA